MVGTRRGSLGISVLADPRAPSRIYESGPLFIECWFMNGYRTSPALQAGLSRTMLKKTRADSKCHPTKISLFLFLFAVMPSALGHIGGQNHRAFKPRCP